MKTEWNDAIEAAKAICHDVATGKINPKTSDGCEPSCAEFACMIALDTLKRETSTTKRTVREVLQETYPEHMVRTEELASPDMLRAEALYPECAGMQLAAAFCWPATEHDFWLRLSRAHGGL